MKLIYMVMLLIFQIGILIIHSKIIDEDLRLVLVSLVGQIAIAICIIGALG